MWHRNQPFVLGGTGRAHLEVRGLNAGYGQFMVLRDLRLEAKPGLTVILGPNGAGKSTLLRALNALIPRDREVLLDDADLDDAVNAAAFGCFANSGQICMSTERIVVDRKVADEFVKKFANKARQLPLGDPRKADPVVLGSVIGMNTVEHCNALIDDALAKGAKLVCGGRAESTLMPATLLDHVTPEMRIYREETFGAVKAIVRVKDAEEAIACANDNEYGLSAAVFGRDIARAFNVARQIDSGICHVNGPTVHDEAQMPFGGVKGSGIGRFGGKAGIAEFTDLRWITVQTTPRHYPF